MHKYNIKLILKSLINTYKKRCNDKNIAFRSNINSDMPEFLYGDVPELKDYTAPLCIEFNCISTTGARIYLNSSTGGSNIDRTITSYITGNNKVKLIVRENDYDLIIDDDVKLSNVSHSLVAPFGIRFVVNSNCSLKYKDFRIYPI